MITLFRRLFRRKIKHRMIHCYYKLVMNNQLFMHEGRKYQKLDATRSCTTTYPVVIRDFQDSQIVISINY